MSRKYKNIDGFTLMELVVIMAILAILMLIAIPAFSKYLPDTTKSMCQKNAELILRKYEYEVSTYNRRMHKNVYEMASSDDMKTKLEEIQKSVLLKNDTVITCPKEGKYTIFDALTVAGHVTRVNCSVHDADNRTAEEVMLDKIRVDLFHDIEVCRVENTTGDKTRYRQNCLQEKYGKKYFTGSSGNEMLPSQVFKDENLGALIFEQYEKGWPELDKSMFKGVNNVGGNLFIRPKFLKPGTNEVILFASNHNASGSWQDARALYYDGQWYKSGKVETFDWIKDQVYPGKVSITSYISVEIILADIKNGTLIPLDAEYPKP